jgi:hypothetical protein
MTAPAVDALVRFKFAAATFTSQGLTRDEGSGDDREKLG